ncbi:MAG: pimeloyl-ACP methyl esterase BioG family protein [Pseudomonadota bacterium]
MKGLWLHRTGKQKLIIFCNGWGMDEHPFQPLSSSEYDVYMLCDYHDLIPQEPLENIAHGYRQVSLISWSMGVWVGQKLFSDLAWDFHSTIAVNGTLYPIDDDLGIPEKIFSETLSGFDETNRMKFYRRMCREKTNLKMFLMRQPKRSADEQRAELAALEKNIENIAVEQSIYRKIIIAEYDWVIPSANQRRFWSGRQTTEIAGFHFLFYLWPSWDQLLQLDSALHI